MRSLLSALSLLALLVFGGLYTGWLADESRMTALMLVWEPGIDLAGVLLAYALWAARYRSLAATLLIGTACSFLAVRLPWPKPGYQEAEFPPRWAEEVQGCLPAIPPPQERFQILQWSFDDDIAMRGAEQRKQVLALATSVRPDLLVLSGAPDEELGEQLLIELGGEYRVDPPEAGSRGRLVLTRGAFSICGGDDAWFQGRDSYQFVRLSEQTTAPLMLTEQPGAWGGDRWEENRAAWRRLQQTTAILHSASTILLADAPALPTWRHTNEAMQRIRLIAAPTVPNWPASMAGLPTLPLHPADRLWVGRAWRVQSTRRLDAPAGGWAGRAPLLHVIEPDTATAGLRGAAPP